MQRSDRTAPLTRHHRLLSASEALVAVSAWGGAVGLATGKLDLGPSVTGRLPGGSPVVSGLALATVVGVPMTIAAVQEWRSALRADVTSMAAGSLLVGWIGVEMTVIRSFSWLQPAYAVAGAGIAAAGWHARSTRSGRPGRTVRV